MADTDASILTEDKKEKGDTETTGRRRSKTASEKKEKKEGDREPKKSKKSKKKGEASKDLESLETPKNTTKEKDFPSIVSPRRRSATDYLLTPTPQKRDTKKVSKKVEKTVITPKKKKKRAVAEVVTEKDSSDLPKPTDVEGTHSEPIKPISEATALSNNHSSPHPPRSMLPIQPPKEDEKDKNKKKGWKFWGKKKGEVQVGGIIAGSVKQEGHAGFDDSGSLRTEGLPPAIAAFFKSLDEMFRKSDQAGLTQQEVVFVLRKYGHLLPTTAPPAPIKLTAEELEERNKKLCEEVNNLNKTISNLTTTNQELNNVLASERQQLQQQIKMNTDLQVEITAMSSGETGDGAGIKKSDALLNLENTFRNRLDELSKKLEEEQKKSADLQVELNAVSSERNTLQARIAELERGNAKASANLSNSQSIPSLSDSKTIPSSDLGVPPPVAPPPPPVLPVGAPPAPPPPTGGLNLGSVTLKPTEPKASPVAPVSSLLADIRKGASLKHVEEEEKAKPVEDESNILLVIARELMNRRNGIVDDDEKVERSDEDDWDD